MKKEYVIPKAKMLLVKTEMFMADSIHSDISDDPATGPAQSKDNGSSDWYDD